MFLSYLQDPQFFFLHCYMIAKLFSGSPNGKKLFACSEDLFVARPESWCWQYQFYVRNLSFFSWRNLLHIFLELDLEGWFVPAWIIIYLGFFRITSKAWSWIYSTEARRDLFNFTVCSLDRFPSRVPFRVESHDITHAPGGKGSAFLCFFCNCSTFSWFLNSWNVAFFFFNLTSCYCCFNKMTVFVDWDCASS